MQKLLIGVCAAVLLVSLVPVGARADGSQRMYVAEKMAKSGMSTADMIFESRQIISAAFEMCSRKVGTLPRQQQAAGHAVCKEMIPARTALENLEAKISGR